jgi:ubiquinone/menaquinone biosynthesis C-methylase UbiE
MTRGVDYDQVAPGYDRRYQVSDYSGIAHALMAFVGEPRPVRVLEVGCGTGHWLQHMLARGVDVAGLDASPGMLEAARARLPGAPLMHGHAEHLPCPDASFDRVVCINAFHHFTDKPAFLREARRVLRAHGGVFSVGLDPHTGLDRWCIYDYFENALELDRVRYPSAARIRTWLIEAGFTTARTEEVQHIPLQLDARAALAEGRLDKRFTSQLSLLTDAEYQTGIDRVQDALEAAKARGERLMLGADLRLYGTFGGVG